MTTSTVTPNSLHAARPGRGPEEPIDRLAGDTTALRSEVESPAHRREDAPHIPARPSSPPDESPSADELEKAALRRIEASRAALRAALLPAGHRSRSASEPMRATASYAPPRAARSTDRSVVMGLIDRLTRRLREGQLGVAAGTAFGFLRAWWRAQPFHTTGEMLALAARTELRPVARRHPWLFLGSAALAGGLLYMVKPWRWAPVAATTRPLVSVATRWSLGQLASPALQLTAAGMLSAWIRQRMQMHETEEVARERIDRTGRVS